MQNGNQTPENPGRVSSRRRWLVVAIGVFAVIGLGYLAYWALELRHRQFTDDAYVGGSVVQITPQISGTVVAIYADDTDFVKTGQILVALDQADAKVALAKADAQLASKVREVRGLFSTTAELRATVAARESDLARANQDLARRERVSQSGAVSAEEVQHALDAVNSARAALDGARQQLEANRARTDRTSVADHPDVRGAAAQVREAYLDFARTSLPAPVSGFVAKRAVQLGQRVAPGTPLMAVVPLDRVWVDANFKEPQLASMRVGQPATLKADLYGGAVDYHGRVIGFGPGTGAAFALLPAQNATGNWIKIVQRLPVRIGLDPRELAAHPLQIGLSMAVEVDTHDHGGNRLPQITQNPQMYATQVYAATDDTANARVQAIIAANAAQRPASDGTNAGVAAGAGANEPSGRAGVRP